MPHPSRISILSSDHQLTSHMQLRLHSRGFQATTLSYSDSTLGGFYADPPDLLIIDLASDVEHARAILATLRNDSFFSAIPVIGVLDSILSKTVDWDQCPFDDFITLPLDYNELFSRIALALTRIKRIFDNNPLTRLPGNTSIQLAIEASLGTATALCYIDLNNFKPYNDVYGFAHGDEVIRMTARIMFNTVRDTGGGFCGHIGGDDFVCIVPRDNAEIVCETIISNFDVIVLDLFDDETKKNGFYRAMNRKGDLDNIPILAISIGVVPLDMPKLKHSAKVSEIAAELKKLAKASGKSCFVVDHRAS